MRVFVTGGTGHSGSFIVPELIAAGHEVTGLARSDTAAAALTALGATVRRGGLEDLDELEEAAADSDGVVHVAHRQDLLPTGGMSAVAAAELPIMHAYGEALAGTGKPLVVAGSIGSPGDLGRPIVEEDPALPSGDEHKGTLRARNAVERAVIDLAERGVRSSVVRIANIVHDTTDNAGFLPLLIALAKEKGPAGSYWHAVEDGGVSFREIAEAIGSRLDLPVVSIPADELMMPGYFGFLANIATQSHPASNLVTCRTLGWEPDQPSLLADLDNGHYFPAVTAPVHDDVATLEDFVRGGEGALAMVDENAVWREAESLPWGGEWRGPDGFARLTREIDVLAELTARGHEIVRAGDVVELRLDAVFTSRKSGRQLPMTVVEHYRVHDGKIYGADAFYKDTQAVNDLVKNG